ncbi:MAG: hypothetical protein ACYC7J_09025 [Syntrophales bacterium]
MKKTITLFIAGLLITAAGCQQGAEAPKAAAPSAAPTVAQPSPVSPAPQATPQAAPPTAAPHPPIAANPGGGDPHAGMQMKEIPAGTGHRGKVLQVLEAGGYTYLEVEEKGKKLWVASLKVKAAKGDTVEFPDSKPMENFPSKALNRTFDKVFFAEGVRVVK